MEHTNTLDLAILKTFNKFIPSDLEGKGLWMGTDSIVGIVKDKKGLFYRPETKMFQEEFGILDLSGFISLVSLLENVEIKMDLPQISFVDKENGNIVKYTTSSADSFAEKRDSITRINKQRENLKALIEKGEYVSFTLKKEAVTKLLTSASVIGSKSVESSIISITKDEGSNDILISAVNEGSFNVYSTLINDINNPNGFDALIARDLMANRLIDTGEDWDVYIFTNEFGYKGKKTFNPMMYMKSKTFDLIVIYNARLHK